MSEQPETPHSVIHPIRRLTCSLCWGIEDDEPAAGDGAGEVPE